MDVGFVFVLTGLQKHIADLYVLGVKGRQAFFPISKMTKLPVFDKKLLSRDEVCLTSSHSELWTLHKNK